jgi:uncharacterized protein (TIGR02453 family)
MLSKETLAFLKNLDKNNNREWFQAHKGEFEAAKSNVAALTGHLIGKMSRFDPDVAGLLPDACAFRIYRDIRFSKNKDPYKNNMGAYISPGGRKSMAPGYYLHIQPGNSFVAGGKYHPDSGELLKIRNAIADNSVEFLKILRGKKYRELFGEMSGDRLKNAPKGFPADHKAVKYLKLKDFVAYRELFDDKFLLSDEFPDYVVSVFKQMYPLNMFLRKALA